MADDLPEVLKPTWFGKASRKDVSKKEIKEAEKEISNNPDYAKNGWTPEQLAIYFKERKAAQSNTVLYRKKPKPTRTNGRHNPHRWRK